MGPKKRRPPARPSTDASQRRRSPTPPPPSDEPDEDEMSVDESSSSDDARLILAPTRAVRRRRSRRQTTSDSDPDSNDDDDFQLDLADDTPTTPAVKRPRRSRAPPPPKPTELGDASPPRPKLAESARIVEGKKALLTCPYFQRIHRPGELSNLKAIRLPKDRPRLQYCKMKLSDLRDRIKFICRRLDLSQQQLADCLGVNNGNMSASLKGAYKPASSHGFIYLLWQWAYYMDLRFVNEFKAYITEKEALPDGANDDQAIAKVFSERAGLAIDDVRAYLAFDIAPATREPIDVAVLRYRNAEAILSAPRRGRARTRSRPPGPVDVDHVPKSGPRPDAATEALLRSWQSSRGVPATDVPVAEVTHPDHAHVRFHVDRTAIALDAFDQVAAAPNDVFINAGGPVTVLEWIATDNPDRYYLMLCSQSAADADLASKPALIQIHEVTTSDERLATSFRFATIVDGLGCIVSAQLCPYHMSSASLGVAAFTGADGSLAIVSIPDRDEAMSGSTPAMIRVTPAALYKSSDYLCHSLAWHPNMQGDFPILVSGTHQGSVLLFDIRTSVDRPELVIPVARSVNDCVTHLAWCRRRSSQFAIGTHSGIVRLFDLRAPYVPVWTYDVHRPVFGIESVENGEGFLIAMVNGVRFLSPSNACTCSPLFWLDLPLEGVTPTSLSLVRIPPSHLIVTLTTDNGLTVFAYILDRIYTKKAQQDRIVAVLSSAEPSADTSIRYAKARPVSYEVVTLARSNARLREKLRKALPKAGTAAMLLNPAMLMTRCAVVEGRAAHGPLLASGGCAGLVRLQMMPQFRSPS